MVRCSKELRIDEKGYIEASYHQHQCSAMERPDFGAAPPAVFCLEKFLVICRTAAPGCPERRLETLRHLSFYALRVSQRPRRDYFEKFSCVQRTD
jgi:hypothetical protein